MQHWKTIASNPRLASWCRNLLLLYVGMFLAITVTVIVTRHKEIATALPQSPENVAADSIPLLKGWP